MQGSPVVSIMSRLPRSAPRSAATVRRPVRLTRRGRFVGYVLLAVLAAGVLAALLAFDPAASAGSSRQPGVTEVVVKPGDTLWSVAVAHEPSRDPSATIEEIRRLNSLSGYTVHPGQTLRLP
ncbi:MAG: LysM peptidoglycan-binding domain-containing protein [Micromonosporaceae bacterium]